MAFWQSTSTEPKMKYRFLVNGGGLGQNQWHAAKSIDKPSYEINTGEYQLGNYKFKYPGVLTWNDIELVFVDVSHPSFSSGGESWYYQLLNTGYDSPDGDSMGIHKNRQTGSRLTSSPLPDFYIEQYDAGGKVIETWVVKGAFVKSVNFGTLAYEEDGFVEITVGISYDYAERANGIINPGAVNAAAAAAAAGQDNAARVLDAFAETEPGSGFLTD